MDIRTRQLQRELSHDPSNIELRDRLVKHHARNGDFLIQQRDCDLPQRGIFEGGYFACFSALHLIHAALQRAESFDPRCFEYWDDGIDAWLDYMLSLLLSAGTEQHDIARLDFENSMHSMDCVFRPRLTFGQLPHPHGWEDAEGITSWNCEFTWIQGQIRNTRNSVDWRNDQERQVPDGSTIYIKFSWPGWFSRIGREHSRNSSHGEMPRCSIMFESPTPEMVRMLCGLNREFFTLRELPLVPHLQQLMLADDVDADGYYVDIIPLHLRGELVMPTCEQLRNAYYRVYPNSNNPDGWMFHVLSPWCACVRCTTCNTVYSVYQDGGDDPGVYCQNCQYQVLMGYSGSNAHIRAFVAQYATDEIYVSQYEPTHPAYIPPDCSPAVRDAIYKYFADRR